MGWKEGDLARVLGVLIFLLVIHESEANLSSPRVSPPATEIRDGGDIHGKSLNGSPITLQLASAPSRRILSLNPQSVQQASRGIHPLITSPSSAVSFNDISVPQNKSNTLHAPSKSPPHPPEGRKTHRFKHVLAISPTEIKIDRNGKNTDSSSLSLHQPISKYSAPLSSPAQNSKKKRYSSSPYDTDHVISSHFNPPIKNWNNKRRHSALPNFNGLKINPSASHATILSPKHKRSIALSPYIAGPMMNQVPSNPADEISNNKTGSYAPPPYVEGPEVSSAFSHPPMEPSKRNISHHAPSPSPEGHRFPPIQAPTSSNGEISAAPSPTSASPSSYIIWQIPSPQSSPSKTFGVKPLSPSPQPKQSLPPPPPNHDCGSEICQPPLTNPCLGSPCTCVLPIKVGLRLGIALYIFFPLVSEFAEEIADGVSVKQRQVRVMEANAAIEDSEKTDVLIHLVPLGRSFDNETVFMTFEKLWKKDVLIQASQFGDYVVLYVSYPGLPPSPPTAAYLNGAAYANNNNGRTIHPLAADVRKKKRKLAGSVIAIIALISLIALVIVIGASWLLLLRNREPSGLLKPNMRSSQPSFAKSSGINPMGLRPSSTSASFSSSIVAYNGLAKTFTLAEMERATNRFDSSRVLGEGGFGRVYRGALEDGTLVAVKVLKRDDSQGEREFMAEVEMLSRLHHRNLVKLIGICAEENVRCLVYELIPNGSVESHLHGIHKEIPPLDWNARVKIALGAARALTYLHEDSSPLVIHRDFKSSNILLEHDFTPRVSDFGLARSTFDEGKDHISTRVMGTFGYVDPEYAMTGHLLVKSDVYSYGVVLLELLTGRKPIEMSHPPGHENLVASTRSLLTNIEGLETIIDPVLGINYPRNSVAKVAAIASMCVQPEVSNRPLMSEVVQALKLVWNEGEEDRQSESNSQDELCVRDVEYGGDRERAGIDVFYASSRITEDASGSFRLHWSSGPLRTGRNMFFWRRVRGWGSESLIESGFGFRRHGRF